MDREGAIRAALERHIGKALARGVLSSVEGTLGKDFTPTTLIEKEVLWAEIYQRARPLCTKGNDGELGAELRSACQLAPATSMPSAVTPAAIMEVLKRYVPLRVAEATVKKAWRLHVELAGPDASADLAIADIMQSMRVFCDADKLATLMVDLAELLATPPSS